MPELDNQKPLDLTELSIPAATSLLPLVARARARTQFPGLGFVDENAEHMVEVLRIPPDLFGNDPTWLKSSILRAKWFDDRCREFLKSNPRALGISLGAGLDNRFQRLNEGDHRWVDVDLPEVTNLKSCFVNVSDNYQLLACDVTDPVWMDQIGWQPGTALILNAEGLLMYLDQDDVGRLFRTIAENFSRGGAATSFLFDYVSPFLAANSWVHPALAHTNASFRSGLVNARAIRSFDPRFEILEDYNVLQDSGYAALSFSIFHRTMTLGQPPCGLAHARLRSG